MKTLDEVIKALRCTDPEVDSETKCNDCPYKESHIDELWHIGPSCLDEMFADTRFYLKKYRWIVGNCADALSEKYPSGNVPLTWDELKRMKGKPVWVEDNLETPEDIKKYWTIMRRIEKTEGEEYILLSDFYYEKSQYGIDWIAYRKEQ